MGVDKPQWDELYRTAATQEGHFTTAQAAGAGYSPQLLAKHLANGRIERRRRGVYRLVHYPAGDHEDLVVLWLWSERKGVFSHETALFLHELSDVLPARAYMTVPAAWRRRRLRVPQNLKLAYDDLSPNERTWVGSVPVTTPPRAVMDCSRSAVQPDLVAQAIEQGVARGLFAREDLDLASPSGKEVEA
ncbi:type IV toxin-antitoxin system AbiEi family antitoxin domain-containing protein [Planctomycetota bacterium]